MLGWLTRMFKRPSADERAAMRAQADMAEAEVAELRRQGIAAVKRLTRKPRWLLIATMPDDVREAIIYAPSKRFGEWCTRSAPGGDWNYCEGFLPAGDAEFWLPLPGDE